MLDAIVADGGRSSLSEIARHVGTPLATAHRQVATLVAESYLVPSGRGRHVAGVRLRNLARQVDDKRVVTTVAPPVLFHLATRVRSIAQFGTLEGEMVTYHIKTGRSAANLFTRVGMQLEAYCSAIGKVLLAHLPTEEQEAYLSGGPFVALTDRTITSPPALRQEFEDIRARGFAIDDGEIAADLRCLAVPVRRPDGEVLAAISVSRLTTAATRHSDAALAGILVEAARQIESVAFADPSRTI